MTPYRDYNQRLQAELASTQQDKGDLVASLARAQTEAAELRQASAQRDSDVRSTLVRLAVACARYEREANDQRLQQMAPRLGSLAVRRQGIDVVQVWEQGQAGKDLAKRLDAIAEQKKAIEAARKAAKSRLPLPGQPLPTDRAGAGAGGEAGTVASVLHPDDWVVQVRVVALDCFRSSMICQCFAMLLPPACLPACNPLS